MTSINEEKKNDTKVDGYRTRIEFGKTSVSKKADPYDIDKG